MAAARAFLKTCEPVQLNSTSAPMSILLSLDSGSQAAGLAAFEDSELVWAGLVRGDGYVACGQRAAELLFERFPREVLADAQCAFEVMQVYRQKSPNPNDLIPPTLMAGYFFGQLGLTNVKQYQPHEWKGQIDKKLVEKRVKSKLSADELGRIDLPPKVKSLHHNIFEAVGIGLHHLRIGRRN